MSFKIFLGGSVTLLSKGVNLLVSLVTIPIIYNYLSKEQFGVYMTILSFVTMLSFSDFGLGYGLLNKIAIYNAQEK
jgi:O-antigen/teichoic acid export membrane protein